jgi:hypothetical protein
VYPRIGFCIISPDPDIEASPYGIYYPHGQREKPKTGLCLAHNVSTSWDEVDLTQKRVIFDRLAARPFRIVHREKEVTFYSITQWAILAVLTDETKKEIA